jgi:hypothetical protein
MVTKEQCLLQKVLDEVSYGRNQRLIDFVLAGFNQGKKYSSDMVFANDERGLDRALQGFSPSFIVYSVIGEDTEYNASDPFFTIDSGIRSFDEYDFQRMLQPEDTAKILSQDVLDELDDSDFYEAFETFVQKNYPNLYRSLDYDVLDGYNSYDFMKADWNQLVKQLQQGAGQQMNEAVKLNEHDLKRMTNSIVKEILKKGKK